ncbi:cystatin-B-like [Hyperolius riggenbachi]|uniref:cystatin-B-like n=1 Tax=Hyperolius riggenbachi TaxID=752182 RepID=UPI0035A2A2CF
MAMCGGIGNAKAADAEVQAICELFKAEVEAKSGKKFGTYEAHSFKTQLVSGTNYFVKVHVGNEEYVHLRIYKKLPCHNEEKSLTSHQLGKTKEDPIEYF